MMKTSILLILFIVLSTINFSCTAQSDSKDKGPGAASIDRIEVYYFHFSHRCATCKAIEEVARNTVEHIYGDEVTFTGYNLDEEEGKQKAEALGVSGQTLLIVNGNKKINLTNEGFMYARSNPEKLQQTITSRIDPML